MDEQLPEVQKDRPPAPSPEGARELVVSGNEIYLPDSKRFKPGDPDFAAVVADVLPEYAPSLSDEVLDRPRRYPVWAVVLILLFFGSLITGLFLMRPVRLVETTSMEVPKPEITRYSGEFSKEYRKAMDLVESQKYGDARECLEKIVETLFARWEANPAKAREEESKNELIFYSYFCLFKNLPWDDKAGEHLDRLIRIDSDYRWKIFEIQYLLWRMGGEKPGRLSRRATVASLYKIMGKIDDLRRLLAENRELTRQLDLYKCYFGLKVWRLLNRDKPDDERGFGDREEVWKIAARYPNDIKFAFVRLYLVSQLLKETKGFYTFNDKKYYLNKHLEIELEKINREIAALRGKHE